MPTPKEFVIDTLEHAHMQRIRFFYDVMPVYPSGYERIAHAVSTGRIEIRAGTGASYRINAEPGTVHTMTLHYNLFEEHNGGNPVERIGPLERKSIVHESTHALQDYHRHGFEGRTPSLSPQSAEGAAYVAGAMAAVLWGLPRNMYPAAATSSQAVAHRIALDILDGRIVEAVPHNLIRQLNPIVLRANDDQYVFNGL